MSATDMDATEAPRYMDAVNAALAGGMDDDDVILLGVDIGRAGGAYGVTRGLYDRFGAERVIDTPIAEAGLLGAAVGAALAGQRPVVEVIYMDFIAVCLDPIINQAAKLRYMTGGTARVPIVFRTQTGGGRSSGAQHSQSLEGMLSHVPGLDVYCPSDSRDAYDLLLAAIRVDHPVCFIENRRLYGRRHADWKRESLPPGKARIVRRGTDVTVISWGRMMHECAVALDELGDGVSAELIDLRTVVPLDAKTIVRSVVKTGRALVVHEAVERFGPGGEVVSCIINNALFHLDGPVRRYGALSVPVPYSPVLEAVALPGVDGIAKAVQEVARG